MNQLTAHRERGAHTRERLLQAGMEEFAIHGFRRATVRDICRRAGVNVNAVRYYFQDKRGLYLAALSHSHQQIHQQLMDHLHEGTAEQRLAGYIRAVLQMVLASPAGHDLHHRILMHELADPSEGTEEIVHRFIGPRFERLNGILSELLPAGVPPFRRRLLAFSVIGQCMHYKVAMPIVRLLCPPADADKLDVDHLSRHIFEVTLAAVRAAGDG